jgi:hypothetical protein
MRQNQGALRFKKTSKNAFFGVFKGGGLVLNTIFLTFIKCGDIFRAFIIRKSVFLEA